MFGEGKSKTAIGENGELVKLSDEQGTIDELIAEIEAEARQPDNDIEVRRVLGSVAMTAQSRPPSRQ